MRWYATLGAWIESEIRMWKKSECPALIRLAMTTSNPNSFSAFFSQNNREIHFLCNFVPYKLGFSKGASSLQSGFKKVACAVHCCLTNECVSLKDFESAYAQKGCHNFNWSLLQWCVTRKGLKPWSNYVSPFPGQDPPPPPNASVVVVELCISRSAGDYHSQRTTIFRVLYTKRFTKEQLKNGIPSW